MSVERIKRGQPAISRPSPTNMPPQATKVGRQWPSVRADRWHHQEVGSDGVVLQFGDTVTPVAAPNALARHYLAWARSAIVRLAVFDDS